VIAVDTNVVVRLLTGDDPRQMERAKKLFASGGTFLPNTVVLETEWVLRRLYRLSRAAVADALGRLISLPNVECENEPAVRQALDWSRSGLDFADALHLASSSGARRFATFDLTLIKTATPIGISVIET
jgi:predicted nucleic-acid-binding protein